jgi:hypothetical protein
MAEKLVVGPINKGLKTYREPFVIDNDSFPVLQNAYQWRGRIKRKRGTTFLCQLQRFINATGLNTLNLISGMGLEANSSVVQGSISLTGAGGQVWTEPAIPNGTLVGSTGGSGTINYSTGAFTGPTLPLGTSSFQYYPQLPVMGLEVLQLNPNVNQGTLAFDTVYSYLLATTIPSVANDVSFYKNPPSSGSYVRKNVWTPTSWNGKDYQQFWTVNYAGALWATNGIQVPFVPSSIGMQFAPANTILFDSQTATTIVLTITNCPLVIGDFVFLNEFTSDTPENASTINFQSGFVTNTTGTSASLTVTITLPNAAVATDTYTPGIVQYLTNRSNTGIDCLRWFDGDPTNGSATTPVFLAGNGWVNFMPPLSEFIYSIADLPLRKYYLVGARMIVPFKDRLLFFGPVVQASTGGSIYLQDTVIYSQNGTPYYTASFGPIPNSSPPIVDPLNVSTVFNAILVPINQTATAPAWFEDQVGFGGFLSAGVSEAITYVSPNEDVLLVGFSNTIQTRLVATGNDVVPFDFFIVNSEYGTSSTFSFINMDKGIMSKGNRGYIITSQVGAERFDIEIPDEVFEVKILNNGNERFTAERDFLSEWVYFTYPSNQQTWNFPNQTLFYNYRDGSFAIFNECYTTYGQFKTGTQLTWATLPYNSWTQWTSPWNAGQQTSGQVIVIAGNQQGFVVIRNSEEDVNEATSIAIQSFSGSLVTSPNHTLNNGDYIIISDCLGTIGSQVNDEIFQVVNPTVNSFSLNPNITSGTYFGGGYITRMYVPFIQTKQFPVAWNIGRKTRIGPQMYLLDRTSGGQITVQIYLSQNDFSPYNAGPIYPSFGSQNDSLIYSQIVFTCPESTNLGLTPANINLNMITGLQQAQIWHRMNTSLIGDTVQLGFTLSDAQMRDVSLNNQFSEITLHGFIVDVSPSMSLA